MTTLYAIIDADGEIETLFGTSPQDAETYPYLTEISNGSEVYKKYYSKMKGMAIEEGMIPPA